MQISSGGAHVGMSKHHLNGAKVSTGVEHVCSARVTKQVRMNAALDAALRANNR